MIAHALTSVRALLAVPFAWWMYSSGPGAAALAGVALAFAVATDLLDGAAARRFGTQSPAGRAFDHAVDFVFVSGGLCSAAARGSLPWLLPAVVSVAFAQYVIDSYWLHRQGELRMSGLGRWNGILYFAPLMTDIARRLGAGVLPIAESALAWLLIASTLLSIADRALAVRHPS